MSQRQRAMVVPVTNIVAEVRVAITVTALTPMIGSNNGPNGDAETTFTGSPSYVREALRVFFDALVDGIDYPPPGRP